MSSPLHGVAGDRDAVLEAIDVSKTYPGVRALSHIDLTLYPGRIHALVGLNGAGKSTLVKILSGVERPDIGELRVRGTRVTFRGPRDAVAAGLVTIHQELSVLPNLSVAENVMLGTLARSELKPISWARMRSTARTVLARLGSDLDVRLRARDLSVAQQQVVELAKALQGEASVVLLDEPTATLPQRDVNILFEVMRRMRSHGTAMVYISHRMEEIYEIADSVSVLRDGRMAGTYAIADLPAGRIVREMIGTTEVAEAAATVDAGAGRVQSIGEPVLEASDVGDGKVIADVSLTLHRGELLAVAGLVGSGQGELSKCLFGARKVSVGTLRVNGRPVKRLTPRRAIKLGLGLLPADRKYEGLVLGMSIRDNTTLANHRRFSRFGVLQNRDESRATKSITSELRLKAYSIAQAAGTLSGGNQQKVVVAKWLVARSKILIFEEPTRGIDVHAKQEIYGLIRDFVSKGGSAIVLSSELSEVMMCDRAIVMAKGRVVGELNHDEMSADRNRLLEMFA